MEKTDSVGTGFLDGLLSEHHKEMIETEWVTAFNVILGLDPRSIRCCSTRQAYWKCSKCGSLYRMSPKERTRKAFRGQEACFYCRGRRQIHPFTV